MPTKIEITNGPAFKQFVFMSNLFNESEWIITFKIIGDARNHAEFTIISIGRPMQFVLGEEDEDLYSFIGFTADVRISLKNPGGMSPNGSREMFSKHFYYVGQYNTRTRRGECLKMDAEEFFASPIAALLLGAKAEKFYRENHWMK